MQQVTDATIQLATTLIAILLGVIALCAVVEGTIRRPRAKCAAFRPRALKRRGR